MYEYIDGKYYGGNTAASSYITVGSGPRVKRVTVTVYEYDSEGKVTKETVTETEYTDDYTYQPVPYQPYTPIWSSSISSDPGPIATNESE